MPSLRVIGLGFVFLGIAIGSLLPIFLVVYPAIGLTPRTAGDPAALLPIVARIPMVFVGPGVLEIAGHAVGAVALMALWFRYGRDSLLLSAATLGGLTWMAVDVVDSAIAIQLVPHLGTAYVGGDAAAAAAFSVTDAGLSALRLAGHFAGGLGVVGIATGLLRLGRLHPAIGWSGVVVGALLAANPFLPALLNVSFLTLPPWLIVFGIAVARGREGVRRTETRDARSGQVATATAAPAD